MLSFLRLASVAILLLSFLACSSNDPATPSDTAPDDTAPSDTALDDTAPDTTPDADTSSPLVLSNGLSIALSDTDLALTLDGERTLLTLALDAAPLALTFDETAMGPFAIWSFSRTDERALVFDQIGTPQRQNDQLTLTLGASERDATATLTLSPGPRADTSRLQLTIEGAPFNALSLPIRCTPEGTFHGWGEQYNATDQRGEAFTLLVSEQGIGRRGGPLRIVEGDTHTTYFPMPYYLDARGFGVLFNTDYRTEVDLCATDPSVARVQVVSSEPLDVLIFHGPTPLDVIRQLGDELGRPGPIPDWAFDLWIGIQGGSDAVLAEADALALAQIPVGALWAQDWTGVRPNIEGTGVQYRWVVDPNHYPDLAGLIDTLHQRNIRFLGYANPFIDVDLTDHFPAMAAQNLLVQRADGTPYVTDAPNGMSAHPDFSRPETRDYIKGFLREMVSTYGMDGWMVDFSEWLPLDAVIADGSDPRAFHNRYPIEWQRLTREVFDELRPDGDYVMFARAGWTGVQAVSQIHWAGDQEANFRPEDGLPTVVPALLNLGLAGIPYVTHDIAGFSGGPSTKELYLRWVELGAFTPIMRTHEGNLRDENWNWDADAETIDHVRRFTRIHLALKPTFRALADEAQSSSAPILRHLMLVFPDDPQTYAISDQFMIGETLLVAPITAQGVASREVYLPAGTWFNVWTGESIDGGQRVEVAAPIGAPPVFSRGEDRSDLRAF